HEKLAQQLHPYGYELLVSAEGGDQGILMAIKEAPDVILVDSELAVIDGWQVIQILKASTVTKEIPIIALMSPTAQADWQMLLKSDCDDYCLKPVTLMCLLGKLQKMAGNILKNSIDLEGIDRGIPAQPLIQQPVNSGYGTAGTKASPVSGYGAAGAMSNPAEPGPTSAAPKTLVIYIEDHQADSQAMAQIVQSAGYSYANIVDPLHALPQLLELKPQLIFLDLVMPLVNGYELCAQIRRISSFKEIPIIIVTNNDGIADRVRAKVVGASGFMGKPIRQKRVMKVLDKHLVPASTTVRNEMGQPKFSPLF
ncbi:MAG: response regulator, partial [Cyanobacteria bacterium J06642_11]